MYGRLSCCWLPILLLASVGAAAGPTAPAAFEDPPCDEVAGTDPPVTAAAPGTEAPGAPEAADAGTEGDPADAAEAADGGTIAGPADAAVNAVPPAGGPGAAAGATDVPVEAPTPYTWIDRVHDGVYKGVDATGSWVDGLFADDEAAPDKGQEAFGRIGIGGFWDQRDSFDPSFRLRARIPLPHLRNRVGLFFGRAPEREAVENRPRAGSDSLPNRFNDVDDNAWLLGLGYSKDSELRKGLQLDAGVRIRADPELIGRAIYRLNLELSERTLFRPSQTAFWRRTEGFGTTTNLVVDHLVSNRFLVRTAVAGTISEDTDGVQWQSYATLYQDLSGKDTLGYSIVGAGETQAEVEVQNYGFQVRYRRQILREWLFLEVLQSVTWPRELATERRETNYGVGIGFEMYFGPVPPEQLR
jgi:hypothetical protein